MEEIKVNVVADNNEIVIRTGQALPLKEPTSVNMLGFINSVSEYLKKRIKGINQKECFIEVYEKGVIKLIVSEHSAYKDEISGTILLNQDYQEFGINDPERKYSLRQLADFIKMRRIFFDDKDITKKLVADLMNLKGKVNKEMEKFEDAKGNKNIRFEQVVTSNVPAAFTLAMPIFKGDKIRKFNVEVNIVPRDLDMDCYLESVEANDIIREYKVTVLAEQLKEIQTIAPDIVIIYK